MSEFRRRLMMGAALAVPPKPTGYIKFEDPEVAKICVQNFSSDGVGVTYEDAEKVTTLGGKFTGNKSIKTFNEFEYFSNVRDLGEQTFYQCDNFKSIKFHNNVENIGLYCFAYTSLEISINLPNLKVLTSRAFQQCGIKEVINLGTIDRLGTALFIDCSKLNKLVIPSTVNRIESHAFTRTNIFTLICNATTPPSIDFRFNLIPDSANIYVPDTSVNTYQNDLPIGWGKHADKIKPLSTYVEQ